MILSIYLKCLRNKGMSITRTLEIVKLWYSTNAILPGIGYIFLSVKERECGISWICLLDVRV